MAGTKLVLGGIVFRDFEVPEKITFGQEQALHIHKLVGGGRVIDPMGPDPPPIRWQGRFRDADASSRCRAVERLCASGAQVGVSWGSFFFPVVVADFEADYEFMREIPYKITLIRADGGGRGLGLLSTISAVIGADIGALSALGALL